MIPNLVSSPSPLDRLDQAISRMVERHEFQRVALAEGEPFSPAGLALVLITDDPQRNLEILDACVILPEALKGVSGIARWVADAKASEALRQRFGITRAPAVVFLRDGQYAGTLSGIRDWAEYQAEISRLLDSPVQPRPIAIPVVGGTSAQGACS